MLNKVDAMLQVAKKVNWLNVEKREIIARWAKEAQVGNKLFFNRRKYKEYVHYQKGIVKDLLLDMDF